MNDVIKTRRNGAVFEIELDRPKGECYRSQNEPDDG